jgi:hypothetical protein
MVFCQDARDSMMTDEEHRARVQYLRQKIAPLFYGEMPAVVLSLMCNFTGWIGRTLVDKGLCSKMEFIGNTANTISNSFFAKDEEEEN